MRKVKSNKFEVACKQTAKMNGVNIPSEINENESGLFHVAFIETKANKKTLEFEHNVMFKKFNLESFRKNENHFQRLGYGDLVIFHDPTLPLVEEVEIVEETQTFESEKKMPIHELEKAIVNYSIDELEEMLETETRLGAIKLIQEQLEKLSNEA